jgi:hypothetical protein
MKKDAEVELCQFDTFVTCEKRLRETVREVS